MYVQIYIPFKSLVAVQECMFSMLPVYAGIPLSDCGGNKPERVNQMLG